MTLLVDCLNSYWGKKKEALDRSSCKVSISTARLSRSDLEAAAAEEEEEAEVVSWEAMASRRLPKSVRNDATDSRGSAFFSFSQCFLDVSSVLAWFLALKRSKIASEA